MAGRLALPLAFALSIRIVDSFRTLGKDDDVPFVPYEEGFVGYYGEPQNFKRERVNEGSPLSTEFARFFDEVHARRTFTYL
jgi:hypothetical protein